MQEFSAIDARARIGGAWRDPDGAAGTTAEVRDPYRGVTVGRMPVSTAADLDDALDAAVQAKRVMAGMPGYERAALLRRIADEVALRAEAMGEVMARETGKAISDCVTEGRRTADTFRLCAEEAVRIEGEHIPMDASATGAGRLALTTRFPVGVVAAITPFNSPVNLAAHKVGPALASGNTVVLKPSPKAPLSVHLFAEAVVAAGVPDGAFGVVYGDVVAPLLVSDPRVDFVSFTGSIGVGKQIRAAAGMKRVALELGGVGPTFVHGDADLPAAAKACARHAMGLAGQSCASVQNAYVEAPVYEEFLDLVRKEVAAIRFGDPLEASTEVGTLIDEQAAARVHGLVDAATRAGAAVLCGGNRDGALMEATVLTDVDPAQDVVRQEVFGPVFTVHRYTELQPIFEAISASPFGLQCGIFTRSIDLALRAYRSVRTGGVIVNATSRWRSDQMPYGGVKDSGIGREGPRFAIREMTDERLLVFA